MFYGEIYECYNNNNKDKRKTNNWKKLSQNLQVNKAKNLIQNVARKFYCLILTLFFFITKVQKPALN